MHLDFFSRLVFGFNIVTPGKGSKYREFYDLSGHITCIDDFLTFFRIFTLSVALATNQFQRFRQKSHETQRVQLNKHLYKKDKYPH